MIALFVSACALATAVYLYRTRLRRLFLRIPALLLLMLLAASVVLRIPYRTQTRPAAILIDASRSMARYLPGIIRELDDRAFGGTRYFFRNRNLLETIPPPESLGRMTDLTTALEAARRTDPSSIVLLSDGRHNRGPDPRSLINADWDRPIFTVAVGPDSIRDAAVTSVSYPEYVYPDDSFPVDIVVESRGFVSPDSTYLSLQAGNRITGRVMVPLGQESSRLQRRFYVRAGEPGRRSYQAILTPRSAETDHSNNEYTFRVEVLGRMIRVLYYSGHPSFNRRFLRPALGAAARLETHDLIQTGTEQIRFDGRPLDPATRIRAADYDVLILDQTLGRSFPITDLSGAIRAGRGVIFLGGYEDLPAELRDLPPIMTASDLPAGEYKIQVRRIFSVLSPAENLPPLPQIGRVLGLRPDAVVIAESADQPVIAYRSDGHGMVFQITARDLTPWLFRPAGSYQENLAQDLLLDIVHFLSLLGPKNRLVIRADRREIRVGSAVTFTLLSYNAALEPNGGGDFFLTTARESIPFFEIQPSQYEATFYPEDTGEIRCVAAGRLDETLLRSAELTILVQPAADESEMGIDWELLRGLAAQTGGRSFTLADLDQLELPKQASRSRMRTLDLDTPVIYVLIFLLLAADWVLRRRRGVL